jgi:hypothetical protein
VERSETQHFDIQVEQGESITVTLTCQANVWLLDEDNYGKYTNGQPFTHLGGLARHTPIRFVPPHSGHWHLLIDQSDQTPAITVAKTD